MGRISRSANAMIFESHRLAYSWGTKNDAQNIWHAHRHVLDEDCLSTWRYGAVALWRCGAVALRTVVIQCHYKSQVCLLSLSENWLPKIRFMKFFPIKSMRKRCGMVRYNLPNTDIPQGGANSAKSLQRMQITKPEGTWAKAYISVAEKLCQPTLTPKKYPN